MSTYVSSKQDEKTISLSDLKNYFQSFVKPAKIHAIGIEWETLGVDPSTGKAIPYSGPDGIEAVLTGLSEKFGYESIENNGRLIALHRGADYVGLEPGGQLELSAGPVKTLHEVRGQLDRFRGELLSVSGNFPVAWLGIGFHPFSSRAEVEWVPKTRYEIMKNFLGARGSLAHDMMKRTAAVQVSFDFESEADAMEKLRLIFSVTPLVSAVFSHSPLAEGNVTGYLAYRMQVWRNTDPGRAGILPRFLEPSAGFGDYLDYALEAPMMFVVRGERWISLPAVRFRDYLAHGYSGLRATMDDFSLHLSALFPEARLKNRIEVRGADGQRFCHVAAVAGLWKGILYSKEAREEVRDLMKGFAVAEIVNYGASAEREGPRALLGDISGWELAKKLFDIALRGLEKQGIFDSNGCDERVYVEDFYQVHILSERTPAEDLLGRWEGEFRREPARLVEYLKI